MLPLLHLRHEGTKGRLFIDNLHVFLLRILDVGTRTSHGSHAFSSFAPESAANFYPASVRLLSKMIKVAVSQISHPLFSF